MMHAPDATPLLTPAAAIAALHRAPRRCIRQRLDDLTGRARLSPGRKAEKEIP